MTVASFWTHEDSLADIQRVVNQHGLHMCNNPTAYQGLGSALVEIRYTNSTHTQYRMAMQAINQIRSPHASRPS